ncbi:hypothetical protein, variant [Allomyces macrogynus ATCC 38327]|uniref:AB hydrolase-1 domain-containing protein n=1 Tax=Allomyces macrogynus (strain ATCC 38327) TaxID=578462 RepID=A0A0L0T9U0_ALLM3|nr:hypothetical protein, variant [Allomyces macrogynus ATCC 38327]|eukprot:KNE71507.1 hypothetical protein, variant [Allomyces macrogynus ATCC 38327]
MRRAASGLARPLLYSRRLAVPVPGLSAVIPARTMATNAPSSTTSSTAALHTSAAPQSSRTAAAAAATATAPAPTSSVTAQLARKMRGTPRASTTSSASSRADEAYRAAEAAMLAHMPSSVTWTLDRVAIPRAFWPSDSVLAKSKRCRREKAGETYEINTLHARLKGEVEKKPPLVLVHGWGGALGMWVENVEELAREYDVYAVDLLGWGGSSRPNFAKSFANTPEAAQAFFVESLDAWRTAMNLDKITLVGHSMGGFVAGSTSFSFHLPSLRASHLPSPPPRLPPPIPLPPAQTDPPLAHRPARVPDHPVLDLRANPAIRTHPPRVVDDPTTSPRPASQSASHVHRRARPRPHHAHLP